MSNDQTIGAFPEPPDPSEPAPRHVASQAPEAPAGDAMAESRSEFLLAGPPPRPVPMDGRVPWGWLHIALLVGFTFLATLAFGIAIVLLLAVMGVSPSHLRSSASESGMVAVVAQILRTSR